MVAQRLKVLVVGAGASGAGAARQFIRAGHEVLMVESRDGPGGMWSSPMGANEPDFAPDPDPSSSYNYLDAGVYADLVTNTVLCYSEYPMNESWPNFITYNKLRDYLTEYFYHFQLQKITKFKTSVTDLEYNKVTKQWKATLTSREDSSKSEQHFFDFICAAIGPCGRPLLKTAQDLLPSNVEFNGPVYHSMQIRRHKAFEGKRILVFGGGISASEVVGMGVKNSVAKVHWIPARRKEVNNFMLNRYPLVEKDGVIVEDRSHSYEYLWSRMFRLFPTFVFTKGWPRYIYQYRAAADKHPIDLAKDVASITTVAPVINAIEKTGTVVVHNDLQEFLRSVGGTSEGKLSLDEHVDIVVYAYGFRREYIPFIEKIVNAEEQKTLPIWNGTLVLDERLPNFANVHGSNVFGSGFMVAELSGRWLAQHLRDGSFEAKREGMMKALQRKEAVDGVIPFNTPTYEFESYISDRIAEDGKFLPRTWSRIFIGSDWSEWALGWAVFAGKFSYMHYKVGIAIPGSRTILMIPKSRD